MTLDPCATPTLKDVPETLNLVMSASDSNTLLIDFGIDLSSAVVKLELSETLSGDELETLSTDASGLVFVDRSAGVVKFATFSDALIQKVKATPSSYVLRLDFGSNDTRIYSQGGFKLE